METQAHFKNHICADIPGDGAVIRVRHAGSGPPILLLHGFPETHLMWRNIAPRLASAFTVVCADLRGYGASSCPPSGLDHAAYSKRAMAQDMVRVMETLGHHRFCVAGHNRGGRVACRLALDHPEVIDRLAVLDVVPNADVWDLADRRLAEEFWPWSLLSQPEPLPELILTSSAEAVVDSALSGWGTPSEAFEADTRDEYVSALQGYEHAHAICEEYRAGATIDYDHDDDDRRAGRRIESPLLVLWSATGPLARWYVDQGGPLGLWRRWADDVQGNPVDGGHFFPEERPQEIAEALAHFFKST